MAQIILTRNDLIKIAAFSHAMQKTGTRHWLNSAFFDDNKIVMADGHRMTAIAMEETNEPVKAIVPREAIEFIVKNMDKETKQVSLKFTDKTVSISFGGIQHLFTLIDAAIPDWRRCIPNKPCGEYTPQISFSVAYMIDICKAHKLLWKEKVTNKLGVSLSATDATTPIFVNFGIDGVQYVLMQMRD